MQAGRRRANCAMMDVRLTLIMLAGGLALTVFSGWRGARPWDFRKGPRLMPWRFLMLMSAAASIALLIHLAALLGAPMRPPV